MSVLKFCTKESYIYAPCLVDSVAWTGEQLGKTALSKVRVKDRSTRSFSQI